MQWRKKCFYIKNSDKYSDIYIYIYYEYYKKHQKSTWNFLLLQKLAWFGHINHKILRYFSQGKCKYKWKKRKSYLEARKMKGENAYFYSMNSIQGENQSLNHTLYKFFFLSKIALKFFGTLLHWQFYQFPVNYKAFKNY